MLSISVLFILTVINGFYGEVKSGVINDGAEFDCSQFTDDFDVLRQFPFSVEYTTNRYNWSKSIAIMNDEKTFVEYLVIVNETVIPWSLFCLTNLEDLVIKQTPFENGKDFVLVINSTLFVWGSSS